MISVILCGGAGSRLWPISREQHPKPFIRLRDGESLIQKSFLRAARLPRTREIMTVTNRALYLKIVDEFKAVGIEHKSSYLLEPQGRNTAPAIAAAALDVRCRYGDEMPMLILAADHLISQPEAFAAAVDLALKEAEKDKLVTFGIKPSSPDTGFGYIEAKDGRVCRFVEKPDEETARGYLASGNFYWNAGMFCFRAGIMLQELAAYAPELLASVEESMAASARRQDDDGGWVELNNEAFSAAPKVSIDYAVMEKSARVAVVPCDIGWNDIGSWNNLCALNEADERGNHCNRPEDIMTLDTSGCDIHSQGRLVATIGLEDLLIVDTPDALLVADKNRDQEVKHIYENLKSDNHETYRDHRTVFRPWGFYTVLKRGPRFQIKHLEVKPGASLSLQLHRHRSEHWIVVSGMAEVTRGEDFYYVNTNESTFIRAGIKHRVANNGRIPLIMIEVQSGDYLGEDDLVRFDDIYGRVADEKKCREN